MTSSPSAPAAVTPDPPDGPSGLPSEPSPGLPGAVRHALPWLAGAVAGLGLAYGALLLTTGGGSTVPRGTTVLGVPLGGQTSEQAVASLQQSLGERVAAPLTATAGGSPVRVAPAAAGLSADWPATVAAASGRTWDPVVLFRRLSGAAVEPVVRVDQARLDAAVAAVAKRVDRDPVNGAVAFTPRGTVATTEAAEGVRLDQPAASQALTGAYLRTSGPVTLPAQITPPTVDTAAVRQAVDSFARPAVSGPVVVTVGRTSRPVPPATLARYLRVEPSGSGLQPVLDVEGLRKTLEPGFGGELVEPVDATFRISKGRPVVVPGKPGRTFTDASLQQSVLAALVAPAGQRVAKPVVSEVQPDLTTAEAQKLGVKQVIGTFTQQFPYAPYRVQNIGRAARYINGTLLLPGQVYSQNATVRERTPANGYTKGTIIQNGRFKEDYGGGVSTITTALWTAVFYSGLERVEQRAHSFWIPRYRPGLEATVSWGNLDLKFKNDSPYGVFITATSGDNWVTTTLWSTKRYDVSASSGPWTDIRPAQTVYDPSSDCLVQPGEPGFNIVVTRVFSQNGTVVKREPLLTRYEVQNRVICGPPPTAKPAAKPGATPAPSAKPSAKPSPKPSARPSASAAR